MTGGGVCLKRRKFAQKEAKASDHKPEASGRETKADPGKQRPLIRQMFPYPVIFRRGLLLHGYPFSAPYGPGVLPVLDPPIGMGRDMVVANAKSSRNQQHGPVIVQRKSRWHGTGLAGRSRM
jgi:hypothetical protein